MSDAQIVWLNTETAAKRLGITTRTLYRFINEGGLPAYRMGRVIRVKQADVDAFIERSRIEPGTLGPCIPTLFPPAVAMRVVMTPMTATQTPTPE